MKRRIKRRIMTVEAGMPVSPSSYEYATRPDSRMFISLDKAEHIVTMAGSSMQGKSLLNYLPLRNTFALHAHKIIPLYSKRTKFQHLLLARYAGDRIALFQDGEWQFLSGEDAEREFHRHEAKIPALMVDTDAPNVLIIGGGDGLAARDVLEVKPNAKITLVDIDPEMVEFARRHPIMRKLNKGSIDKIKVVPADGISFMLQPTQREKYDLVIIDLPDPIRDTTQHLYDIPLIVGILNVLKPHGVVSIYATAHDSPLQNWLADTLQKAFYEVYKVPAEVAEMGTAGFVWAKVKKPEAYHILRNYYKYAVSQHRKNTKQLLLKSYKFAREGYYG